MHDAGALASGWSWWDPCRPRSRDGLGGGRAVAERRMRPDRVVVPAPVHGFASDRSGPAPRAGCGRPRGRAARRAADLAHAERLDHLGHLLALPEQHVGLAVLGDDLLRPETLARHALLPRRTWSEPNPGLDRFGGGGSVFGSSSAL